jgi:hypothetical protein
MVYDQRVLTFDKLSKLKKEDKEKKIILRPSSLNNWVMSPAEFMLNMYCKDDPDVRIIKPGVKALEGTLAHKYIENYVNTGNFNINTSIPEGVNIDEYDLSEFDIYESTRKIEYSLQYATDDIANLTYEYNKPLTEYKFNELDLGDNIYLQGTADIVLPDDDISAIVDIKTCSQWFTNVNSEKLKLYKKHLLQLQAYRLLMLEDFNMDASEFVIFKLKLHSSQPKCETFTYSTTPEMILAFEDIISEIRGAIKAWRKTDDPNLIKLLFHYNDTPLFG